MKRYQNQKIFPSCFRMQLVCLHLEKTAALLEKFLQVGEESSVPSSSAAVDGQKLVAWRRWQFPASPQAVPAAIQLSVQSP